MCLCHLVHIPTQGFVIAGLAVPLLVEEYPNISPAMQNLMTSVENHTVEEIIIVILYILIVESGFVPFRCEALGDDESCRYNVKQLRQLSVAPRSLRNSDGVYIAYFILTPFSNIKCKLVCVPLGTSLIANMYSTSTDKSFGKPINPADYVALYPTQVTFKRLKSLSREFKNEVVIPIRTVILNEVHQTSVGMFALPIEVLFKIVSYLSVNDFLKWTSTCKYLYHTFSYDDHIWKRFCSLNYIKRETGDEKETFRECFQRKIAFRKRLFRLRLQGGVSPIDCT